MTTCSRKQTHRFYSFVLQYCNKNMIFCTAVLQCRISYFLVTCSFVNIWISSLFAKNRYIEHHSAEYHVFRHVRVTYELNTILWPCALCSSDFIEDLLKGGYLISNLISLISNLDCLCSETKSQFNIKEKCPARIHVIIPRTLFKNLN